MSTLSDTIRSLFEFLNANGYQPPPTSDIRIIEIAPGCAIDGRGRLRIPKDGLQKVASYEGKFEVLAKSGLPWINVSCFGTCDGLLIVGIEVPTPSARPASRTSINYSGPTAAVVQHAWDAREALEIG